MKLPIRIVRNRFGMKSVIVSIAFLAMLLAAWRFSRDQEPAYLYSRWLLEEDESRRVQAAAELGAVNDEISLVVRMLGTARTFRPCRRSLRGSSQVTGTNREQVEDGPAAAAATAALVQALSDQDPTVRKAVADALAQDRTRPRKQCHGATEGGPGRRRASPRCCDRGAGVDPAESVGRSKGSAPGHHRGHE